MARGDAEGAEGCCGVAGGAREAGDGAARRRRGWVAVTPTDSAARDEVVAVTRVDAATADVEVCMLDDDLLVDTTTGAVVNAEVGIHRQRHRFVERDGVWRLAERETLASGADAGCFR